MLDFSRRSESKRTVRNPCDIIDRAIHLASSDYDLIKSYDFRRIKINRDYAPGIPDIYCSDTEIEQVVLNLLRNAAQAMAEVKPALADPTIEIHVAGNEKRIKIEIMDNGPGIPDDIQKRIFEPFFTTRPTGVGTGLGLSVSYNIITKGHDGKISVGTRPNGGAVFTIELPVEGPTE